MKAYPYVIICEVCFGAMYTDMQDKTVRCPGMNCERYDMVFHLPSYELKFVNGPVRMLSPRIVEDQT